MRILLTDGDERATLAAARSLVAAGHDVHLAAGRRTTLAGMSRGVCTHLTTVDAAAAQHRFAAAIGALAHQISASAVIPMTDLSVRALMEHSESFGSGPTLPFPQPAAYRLATDKVAMLRHAAEAGFATPQSVVLDDAGSPIPRDFFPAVLRSHRSIVACGSGALVKTGAAFAADHLAARAWLASVPPEAFPVILQRQVYGAGEGVFFLWWDGRVVAAFAHRRLREKPPEGGVSVYRESIALPPDLYEAGSRLLGALAWNGVAMVECKRDATTGAPVFMEVNGRFWGSLQLAIDAGVDFPRLLAECIAGGARPHSIGRYRVGVRSRWWWGDVDHLYLTWRRRLAGSTSPMIAARVRSTGSFLSWLPWRDREEVFRLSDPLPFVLETARWFRRTR